MIYTGEGSYIDTSLITCAEYQLFLNEQRAKGILFQPDHWKRDSFPTGQGLTPVLGVRPSDALEFCAWLTKRDPGIWEYRLPTMNEHRILEANTNIVLSSEMALGYWIERGKKFAWIRNMSPSIGDINATMQKFFDRKNILVGSSDLDILCKDALPLWIENIWIRISALKTNDIFDRMLTHAHGLEFARFSNYAHALKLANDIEQTVEYIDGYKNNLEREIKPVLARSADHALDLALDYCCDIILYLDRTRKFELDGRELITKAYQCYLELATTLVILDARIKGWMSAKEGILLARNRQDSNGSTSR